MIPRFKPYVKFHDLRFLFRNSGNLYEEFETYFAKLTGSKYALLLPYGRSALYFFLKSFYIEHQEIILPAYNCQSVIGPILETKNIPVCIDSKYDDFNMDERKIPEAITEKTRVILASAMYGSPLPLEAYKHLRGKGIYLIGDYALGFLTFLTRQREALDAFDLVFFSFGISKEITFLSGGMVITNNERIFRRLKTFRKAFCQCLNLSFRLKIFTKFLGTSILFSPLFYSMLYFVSEKTSLLDKEKGVTIGIRNNLPADFAYLPTSFQVKLAFDRLRQIETFLQEKTRIIDAYYHRLAHWKTLRLPPYLPTYSHFPILVDPNERDTLLRFFLAHHIHTTVMFKDPLNQFYEGTREQHFKNAEHYTQGLILLPLYHKMNDAIIERTLNILQTWNTRQCKGNQTP